MARSALRPPAGVDRPAGRTVLFCYGFATTALHGRRIALLSDQRPSEPRESSMHLLLDFVLLTAATAPYGLGYLRRRRADADWDPY